MRVDVKRPTVIWESRVESVRVSRAVKDEHNVIITIIVFSGARRRQARVDKR